MILHTVRAPYTEALFLSRVSEALQKEEGDLLIVVPRLLTLQTERMLLDALHLNGSFRLQVCTAERLCARIFDAVGRPAGKRIDEIGRTMLVRRAVEQVADRLTLYARANEKRGFAQRCAEQLAQLRQANLRPETLLACAENAEGAFANKLTDLALVQKAYEAQLDGRYQDGESEFQFAIERVPQADFLRDLHIFFYGYDLLPADLTRFIAKVAAAAPRVELFLPTDGNEHAPDAIPFEPLEACCIRLGIACKLEGAPFERNEAAAAPPKTPLEHLARQLNAYPVDDSRPHEGAVLLSVTATTAEECRDAAAYCRYLAQEKGYRWKEMRLLVEDLDNYREPLKEAFRAFDVPLFLATSRPAANFPLCECLLSALAIVEGASPRTNFAAMLRTDFIQITETKDENNPAAIDRLLNYADRYELHASAFMKPFKYGAPEELEALEPLRLRAAAPVIALREKLRVCRTLREQLSACFDFLTNIGAEARMREIIARLQYEGLFQAAGEQAQIWNFIVSAMDQMVALMGEEKLPIKEMRFTLEESLSAIVVKPLPQADDAVYAQSADSMLTAPTRALLLLGETDSAAPRTQDLFDAPQRAMLAEMTSAYLGPDVTELDRRRRFRLKHAIAQTGELLRVSAAMIDAQGGESTPGAIFRDIAEVFPDLTPAKTVTKADEALSRARVSAPHAALGRTATALSELRVGDKKALDPRDAAALASLCDMPGMRPLLAQVRSALTRDPAAARLQPATARRLYDRMKLSVTSMESYAACPFRFFVHYGLQPDRLDPVPLRRSDEGLFLHAVMREFLERAKETVDTITPEAIAALMNECVDRELLAFRARGILGQKAVDLSNERYLRELALICAAVAVEELRHSVFAVADVESRPQPLAVDDVELTGIIDRVDVSKNGDAFRIIDYKTSAHAADLWQTYFGLSLQLPVYVALAREKYSGSIAGVFYKTFSDGIVEDDTPKNVEKSRDKVNALSGILPRAQQMRDALSDTLDRFYANLKTGPTADNEGFNAIADHAIHTVRSYLNQIRSGSAAARPACYKTDFACQYCDLNAVCLFDAGSDKARRLAPLGSQADALAKIIEENNHVS